jgi:hypothetical protein
MRTLPRKWALIAVMFALTTVATTAREARAVTSYSGITCQGVFPADTANLTRLTSGNNASTVDINVSCPLSLATQGSAGVFVEAVIVRYEERNTTKPFSCRLSKVAYDGAEMYVGPARWTCGLGGGCPESTTDFKGTGYLQLTPTGGGTTNYIDQSYTVLCTLPPLANSTASKVISYYSQP